MKLPDGYVFILDSDVKGLKINATQIELVRCKNCKYCQQRIFCGTPFWSCVQNMDAQKEVYENDWCCWAEKRDDDE